MGLGHPCLGFHLDGKLSRSSDTLLKNHATTSVSISTTRIRMNGIVSSDAIKGEAEFSKAKECYNCATKFTTLTRRHHCRMCVQSYCYACSSHQVQALGVSSDVSSLQKHRVCEACHAEVHTPIISPPGLFSAQTLVLAPTADSDTPIADIHDRLRVS